MSIEKEMNENSMDFLRWHKCCVKGQSNKKFNWHIQMTCLYVVVVVVVGDDDDVIFVVCYLVVSVLW